MKKIFQHPPLLSRLKVLLHILVKTFSCHIINGGITIPVALTISKILLNSQDPQSIDVLDHNSNCACSSEIASNFPTSRRPIRACIIYIYILKFFCGCGKSKNNEIVVRYLGMSESRGFEGNR